MVSARVKAARICTRCILAALLESSTVLKIPHLSRPRVFVAKPRKRSLALAHRLLEHIMNMVDANVRLSEAARSDLQSRALARSPTGVSGQQELEANKRARETGERPSDADLTPG